MIKEIKNNKLSSIDPQSIREFYVQQGYKFFNPNMTIPANVVMNFMGEDVRNRLLFTDAPDGEELCQDLIEAMLFIILNIKLEYAKVLKQDYDEFFDDYILDRILDVQQSLNPHILV